MSDQPDSLAGTNWVSDADSGPPSSEGESRKFAWPLRRRIAYWLIVLSLLVAAFQLPGLLSQGPMTRLYVAASGMLAVAAVTFGRRRLERFQLLASLTCLLQLGVVGYMVGAAMTVAFDPWNLAVLFYYTVVLVLVRA